MKMPAEHLVCASRCGNSGAATATLRPRCQPLRHLLRYVDTGWDNPSISQERLVKTSWKLAAATACVLCSALLISSTGRADEPSAPEPGIWQKHIYSFAFLGFTSTYSCDGLADKLKVLLIAAGARPDAKSRAGACASGFGRPDKFARADLTFYTLAPTATSAPGAADAGSKPINGTWRPVSFAAHSPRELATGDCELVEQFLNNVLPMFSTRGVENHTTCVPHQESGSVIDLRFDAFAAVPRPPAGAKPAAT
jgi:hypothetical protein